MIRKIFDRMLLIYTVFFIVTIPVIIGTSLFTQSNILPNWLVIWNICTLLFPLPFLCILGLIGWWNDIIKEVKKIWK